MPDQTYQDRIEFTEHVIKYLTLQECHCQAAGHDKRYYLVDYRVGPNQCHRCELMQEANSLRGSAV